MWKNLSVHDAQKLLEAAQSRDSMGKGSTIVRSGQKVDLARVKRTLKRGSANRKTKLPSSLELPTGIECRTPSPEPGASSPDLAVASTFGSPFALLGEDFEFNGVPEMQPDVGDFDFSFRDGYVDIDATEINDCFWIVRRKLEKQQKLVLMAAESDLGLQLFQSTNTLLAILEPILGEQLCLRQLFLLNFVATFVDHSIIELTHLTNRVSTALHQHWQDSLRANAPVPASRPVSTIDWAALDDTQGTASAVRTWAKGTLTRTFNGALDTLGVSHETRAFLLSSTGLGAKAKEEPKDADAWIKYLPILGGFTSSPPDELYSPGPSSVSSAGVSAPESASPAAPESSHADICTRDNFDAAVVAVSYGENHTAKGLLAKMTGYEAVYDTVSPVGQALTRCAWYCLFYIDKRSDGLALVPDYGPLMHAVSNSTCYRDADGVLWEEVSFLFA